MIKTIQRLWLSVTNLLGLTKKKIWKIKISEDVPDTPNPTCLYLVGENENYWAAILICPCGCSEIISLNLLPQASPVWSVVIDSHKRVTVNPSIWRTAGCRSHFFLRTGTIQWCNET